MGRGAKGFAAAAEVYNERFDNLLPNAVARPLDAGDVRDAVRWLVGHGTPMRARSGGHSYAGYSTREGGLVGRAFGLASDNLIAAQIVTADGKLWTVDSKSDPDLLWALRGGGGGNFGVVTQLKLRVHPVSASASWFIVTWPWSSAGAALDAWLRWAPHVKDTMTSVFYLQTGPSVLIAGQYLGPAHDLGSLLAPMASVVGASVSTGMQDYFGLMVRWAGCLGRSLASCHTVGTHRGGMLERASFRAKSDYLAGPLSASGRAVLTGAIERRQGMPGSGAILFDAYGGAINRVAPGKTAFVAYYGANYRRLVRVRREVDPHHYSNFAQAIGH